MFLAQLQQATEQLSKKVAEVRAAEQDVKFLQDNDGELHLMQPVLSQEQNACMSCLH
jgi:prefoldin subunit 5